LLLLLLFTAWIYRPTNATTPTSGTNTQNLVPQPAVALARPSWGLGCSCGGQKQSKGPGTDRGLQRAKAIVCFCPHMCGEHGVIFALCI
jgi:hypothetical protein